MSEYSFSKSERLCSKRAISDLFENGKGGFVHPFRYTYTLSDRDDSVDDKGKCSLVSVLVSVSKRNHRRANKRNLLKRRTREAYRLNKGTLGESCFSKDKSLNIAFIYSSKEIADYGMVENAVKKIISAVSAHI